MASPSGSANGGIIGKSNKTSFGKNILTSITASGPTSPALAATQPGTRLINALVVAGGGSGGVDGSAGGGAGGVTELEYFGLWCNCFRSSCSWRWRRH